MSDKESHVTKSDLTISGGGKSYRQFTLKSPSTIYPKLSVWFTPPPKSPGKIFPLKLPSMIYPPLKSSNFEQNFKRTQHHALLHKGLFCERPIKLILLMIRSWGHWVDLKFWGREGPALCVQTWELNSTQPQCVPSIIVTFWSQPLWKSSAHREMKVLSKVCT